jgi:hypothetical protein
MNSTIHRRKTVTQSSTMSRNNNEHRIHNREKTITGTGIRENAAISLEGRLILK